MRNRLHNCKNPHQGRAKKVLAVCSAGLLRSPTVAARLIARGYNARSCGADSSFALIPLDPVLVEWADEILVMDDYQKRLVRGCWTAASVIDKPIHTLNIPDSFGYMDSELVSLVDAALDSLGLV